MNPVDFYLSEMAVSDLHGGGITLQRVLGSDLDAIGRYFHVSRFAAEWPPVAALRERSEFLVPLFEREVTRKVIGCTLSARLEPLLWPRRLAWRSAAASILASFGGTRPLSAVVCPQAVTSVMTLDEVKRSRKVNYVSWIMDDHVARHDGSGWRYPDAFRPVFARHLREATRVFAISPTLAEHYRSQFGVECEVLFGPADATAAPVYEPPSRDGALSLGYFGRVWQWQMDGLLIIARGLEPQTERLCVYSSDASLPEALRLPGVELRPPVPKEAVIGEMRKHDAVLIPVSFEASQRNMAELNIATKMSECLASGTMTLVCGPSYAAMVRYLQGTGAAALLTQPDPAGWRLLAGKIQDRAYRRQVLDAAVRLVNEQLSTAVMRQRWRAAAARLNDGKEYEGSGRNAKVTG